MLKHTNQRRRQFIFSTVPSALVSTGISLAAIQNCRAAFALPQARPVCAFIKFIQSLPYRQLAETVAELGFTGIEATVRDGGHVLPERVEDDLPKLVEELKKCDLEVTIMASSVNSLSQPHTKKVLETASDLGIKRYRLAYFRYNLGQPILPQLDQLKPAVRELTAFHRGLGLQGLYQNHSGATTVGAPVWDLAYLMKGIPVSDLAIAFDIRHATVEGGLAWPLHFQLARPHLGAIYVKDFSWREGRKPQNVPLGTGQVDPKFFGQVQRSGFQGPVSLHVEYLPKAGVADNITGLRDDLATLRRLWK